MQRMMTSNKRYLFVCSDIELNPGLINISNMSLLITRLAGIGRKPVNIVSDGNCFFRSVNHQRYGTEDRHPQIRALAIQHLINILNILSHIILINLGCNIYKICRHLAHGQIILLYRQLLIQTSCVLISLKCTNNCKLNLRRKWKKFKRYLCRTS